MNLRKPVVEYHLRSFLKAMLWFLGAYIALYLLAVSASFGTSGTTFISGIEITFGLFFMAAWMISFKEENHFMLQLGVSRKAAFIGLLLATLIAATAAALISVAVDAAARGVAALPGMRVQMDSVFLQIFAPWSETVGTVPALLTTVLWIWTYVFAMSGLGFFLANLFYRLNKLGKILVPASLALILLFSPVLNRLMDGHLFNTLGNWFIWIFRGSGEVATPMNSILVFFLSALALFTVCWLFLRRFQVKK